MNTLILYIPSIIIIFIVTHLIKMKFNFVVQLLKGRIIHTISPFSYCWTNHIVHLSQWSPLPYSDFDGRYFKWFLCLNSALYKSRIFFIIQTWYLHLVEQPVSLDILLQKRIYWCGFLNTKSLWVPASVSPREHNILRASVKYSSRYYLLPGEDLSHFFANLKSSIPTVVLFLIELS